MDKISAHYPAKQALITRTLGLLLAFLFAVIAILQLFSFENMPGVIGRFWPGLGSETSLLMAALIVIAEIFALPFLLGMQLSVGMRALSLLLTIGTVVYWSIVAFIGMIRTVTLTGIGIAEPYALFPNGPWFLLMMTGVTIMLVWYLIHSYIDAHRVHHHLRKAHK